MHNQHQVFKTQIPLCERTVILGALSNHRNNKLLNLMIILGKRCIYLNRFGQKLDIIISSRIYSILDLLNQTWP